MASEDLLKDSGVFNDGSARSKPKSVTDAVYKKILRICVLGVVAGAVIWVWPFFRRLVLWRIDLLSTGPRMIAYSIVVVFIGFLLKILIPFALSVITD